MGWLEWRAARWNRKCWIATSQPTESELVVGLAKVNETFGRVKHTTTTVVDPGMGFPLDMDATEIIGAAMVASSDRHTHTQPRTNNHRPLVSSP